MAVYVTGHLDGGLRVDGAGAGGGIECVTGAVTDGETDRAGPGLELRVAGDLACGFNVSGAGLGAKSAVHLADANGAGAGLRADLSLGVLIELDVSGSGLEGGGTVDGVGADGARSAIRFQAGPDVLSFDVARTGGGIDFGAAGKSDLVVDGDVAVLVAAVALADLDGIAALLDGRGWRRSARCGD